MLNRRTAIPALFAGAAVPATALAFQLEKAPPEVTEALGACEARSLHGDLRQAVLDRAGAGPLTIPQLLSLSRCPVCGCGLVSDLPVPESAPRL